MVRILLSTLLILLSFSAMAEERQDNAAIAAIECDSLKNPLNKAKLEAIDIKDFAAWYLGRMEDKYPKRDIATFKHHVLSYKPVEGKAEDANPFVFLSAMACTDGKHIKDGNYGDNLEQSLLWMLDQRAAYFEKSKSKGR